MPETNSAENAAAEPKRRGRLAPMIIIAAMMLGEGVAVFLLAKALSPTPVPALAGEGMGGDESNKDATGGEGNLVEIDLAECRPSNKMSGKFLTFQIRVSGLVDPKNKAAIKDMVRARQARIDDAVNVVMRAADPEELNEPGLESIRRRLRHEFGRVFGDAQLIQQVLIPQLLNSGPGL